MTMASPDAPMRPGLPLFSLGVIPNNPIVGCLWIALFIYRSAMETANKIL